MPKPPHPRRFTFTYTFQASEVGSLSSVEFIHRKRTFLLVSSSFLFVPPHFVDKFRSCLVGTMDPLMGVPKCRLLILRNGNVPYYYI